MASLPSAPSAAAPISQQMEQIDQQIVALLQDIDEAFSNLHQTVATRLIPTVKRFNQNAAPTREFAKVRNQSGGQLGSAVAASELDGGDGAAQRSGLPLVADRPLPRAISFGRPTKPEQPSILY